MELSDNGPGDTGPMRVGVTTLTPRVRVVIFSLLLMGTSALFLSLTPQPTFVPERSWQLPFIGLVAGFALTESTALHIEIRKHTQSVSLSSIPLVFGMLFASPVQLVAAFLLGALPTLVWVRGSDLLKTTWNLSLFAAQASLAAMIVRSVLGLDLPSSPAEWTLVLVAVLTTELLSSIAVPLVILAFDPTSKPQILPHLARYQVMAAVAGSFALVTTVASLASPTMIVFAILPLLSLGGLVRMYGKLGQRYADLEQLHFFTRALDQGSALNTVDTSLVELARILRSMKAGMVTIDAEDVDVARLTEDESLHDGDPAPFVEHLVPLTKHGEFVHITADDRRPHARALLDHLGTTELLAARIRGELDGTTIVFVTGRLGITESFSTVEQQLFNSLVGTLSSRLSNDHLVTKLETQALHDSLTGLPNRLTFELELATRLERGSTNGVVVMLDLDRFKDINDSLGHDVGDQLLIEIANRLRNASRREDVVARFGGDEFALLLSRENGESTADFDHRLRSLHGKLTDQVQIHGIMFEIGASMGAVGWPEQGNDTSLLIRNADIAMYVAKRNQSGIAWYSPDLDDDGPRRLNLSMAVRAALEADELDVYLQPKIAADDGRVTGAEALARWTHPVYGPIGPDEFVPLITQSGLIGDLTRFVIRRAIKAATDLRRRGLDVPVAVNLTPRDLLDPTLPDTVVALLEDAGLPGSSLMVEITEDAMVVDLDTGIAVLNQLRAFGIKVAIDDFGTGYSSLQHLHRLPVDQLKLDRSFVGRMTVDENASAIVRASLGLARDLGLSTVGEGVENERSLEQLAEMGCDEIQGYFVSRPMPEDEFSVWIDDWEKHSLRAGLQDRTGSRPTR